MNRPDRLELTGDGWSQPMVRRRDGWYSPLLSHCVDLWVGDYGEAEGFAIDSAGTVYDTDRVRGVDDACSALVRMIDTDPRLREVREQLLRECPVGDELVTPDAAGQLDLFGGGA